MSQLLFLLVVLVLTHLFAKNFVCSSDNEGEKELGEYTSLFALDIISTGLGTHLIRGKNFDIPAKSEQVIATAVAKTWFTLPHTKKVGDIVKRVTQSCAEGYIQSSRKMSGRMYKHMFDHVDMKLRFEPEVNTTYVREKKNASEMTSLQTLSSGIIDIGDYGNVGPKLRGAFRSDFNLRTIMICTVFQRFAFADVFKKEEKDRYVQARAIVELSKRSEDTERVNQIYRQTVREIANSGNDSLYEQKGTEMLDTKFFPIILASIKKDPILDEELTVIKEYLSMGNLPPI